MGLCKPNKLTPGLSQFPLGSRPAAGGEGVQPGEKTTGRGIRGPVEKESASHPLLRGLLILPAFLPDLPGQPTQRALGGGDTSRGTAPFLALCLLSHPPSSPSPGPGKSLLGFPYSVFRGRLNWERGREGGGQATRRPLIGNLGLRRPSPLHWGMRPLGQPCHAHGGTNSSPHVWLVSHWHPRDSP